MNDPTLRAPDVGAWRTPTRAARMLWQDVHLEGAAVCLPEVVLPTADIEDHLRPLYRKLGFKPGWVEAVTGIAERRVWATGVTAISAATVR